METLIKAYAVSAYMEMQRIFVVMILAGIGLLFFFNSKNISKGAFKFYRKLYTQKNLNVMFKLAGILLVLGAIILTLSD